MCYVPTPQLPPGSYDIGKPARHTVTNDLNSARRWSLACLGKDRRAFSSVKPAVEKPLKSRLISVANGFFQRLFNGVNSLISVGRTGPWVEWMLVGREIQDVVLAAAPMTYETKAPPATFFSL